MKKRIIEIVDGIMKNSMENMNMNTELEQIKESSLSDMTLEKLSSFYSLFADKTRLTLICMLSNNKLCVNDIAEIIGTSQSRVSHQLAVLRKHDIVTFYRQGKQVLYTLTDNHIKDLFNTGLEHISEKDEQVYIDKKKRER